MQEPPRQGEGPVGRDEQWQQQRLLDLQLRALRAEQLSADDEYAHVDAQEPAEVCSPEWLEWHSQFSAAMDHSVHVIEESVRVRNIRYAPKVSPLRVRPIGRSRRERRPGGHRRTARTSRTSSQDPGEGGEPPSDVVAPAGAHLTFGLRDIAEVFS
jgi:hypothetical protein